VAVIATAGLATVTGNYLGSAYSSRKARAERELITRDALKRIQAVEVGKRLPNHVFHDLSMNEVGLASLISGPKVISIISPTCGACEFQLEELSRYLPEDFQRNSVVVISPYHPPKLKMLRDSLNLKAPILFDYGSIYIDSLMINAFPFNIMVDSNLIITDIIVGPISPNDYRNAISME
jgi:hypothetical protein